MRMKGIKFVNGPTSLLVRKGFYAQVLTSHIKMSLKEMFFLPDALLRMLSGEFFGLPVSG